MDAHRNRLVKDAQALYHAAVRSVQADYLLKGLVLEDWLQRPPDQYDRIRVAGMGKASMAMAAALEQVLGGRIKQGAVVVPHGYPGTLPSSVTPPRRIDVLEGAHPVPGAASQRAARRILELAASCGEDDLLIVLISGGGTALCADFAPGISLEHAQAAFRLLLESGADIQAMNVVRKHLSRVSGGRLAQAAAPAETLALVVSDVVGDDLSVIASGPTVPDPSTFGEAVEILHTYALWDDVPRAVRDYLTQGTNDPYRETPKPGSPLFERTRTELLGSNRIALEAAAGAARAHGYATYLLDHRVTGEARIVGKRLGEETRRITAEQPVCLIWGGETTVTVRGKGKGGRNQEVALAAALALEGSHREIVFLSGGTDGRDGPTDAAGAWVAQRTAREARDAGLMPERFLAENDAYTFFEQTGSLLMTGPTHTNVMDVQIALVHPRS